MRFWILLIGLCINTICFSQSDSTLVANTKLIEIATETKSLREQVASLEDKLDIYNALVIEYRDQLERYKSLKIEDDKFISLMQTEVQLRNSVYSEMVKDLYKPKKGNLKELFWFVGGAALAYAGVAIATK